MIISNNIIYSIKNNITGKCYIGRTNSLVTRRSNHFKLLERNSHPNVKLQNSYNKHGKDCFIMEILEEDLLFDKCLEREEFYIDKYNTIKEGYNIEAGGRREKVSIGNMKYWLGKTGENHSTSKKTYQYSLEGKFLKEWGSVIDAANFYKLSASLISYCCNKKCFRCGDYYWSHEFMETISVPKYIPHNVRPVNMIELDTNEIVRTFPNIQSAYQFFGKEKGKISEVCKGKRNIWNGYSWRYFD